MNSTQPPVVLSIAGSDCSAGAGIQADLKTFSAFGCYGLTAVTCVVAEVPGHVASIQAITPEIVRDQVSLLFKTYPIAALKTGMLFSTPIIEAIAEVLGNLKKLPPLILDPVMVASSGHSLLTSDAITAYRNRLFPLASLLTPNLDELCLLAGSHAVASSLEEMKQFGRHLMQKTKTPLLLKGGHLRQEEAIDVLLMDDGNEEIFAAPFLHSVETHGTGCTYSAAIAAGIAQGHSMQIAVANAKIFITQALKNAHQWGEVRALRQIELNPNNPRSDAF
jgi:hydroxymethylpyrimidine/phosphomethylpyrimidine kinase